MERRTAALSPAAAGTDLPIVTMHPTEPAVSTGAAIATALRDAVRRAAPALRTISPAAAARRPGPGKWSPVEILGHLVDSASNNHQRFVRARFRADLRFDGYDQDAWVDVQRWAEAPWLEVLDLWRAFNLHLARLIEGTPDDVLDTPRADHNLDAIGWETVPAHEPATLAYFMRDYVGHLQHHLRQIDAGLAEPPRPQRP